MPVDNASDISISECLKDTSSCYCISECATYHHALQLIQHTFGFKANGFVLERKFILNEIPRIPYEFTRFPSPIKAYNGKRYQTEDIIQFVVGKYGYIGIDIDELPFEFRIVFSEGRFFLFLCTISPLSFWNKLIRVTVGEKSYNLFSKIRYVKYSNTTSFGQFCADLSKEYNIDLVTKNGIDYDHGALWVAILHAGLNQPNQECYLIKFMDVDDDTVISCFTHYCLAWSRY